MAPYDGIRIDPAQALDKSTQLKIMSRALALWVRFPRSVIFDEVTIEGIRRPFIIKTSRQFRAEPMRQEAEDRIRSWILDGLGDRPDFLFGRR